MRKKDTVVFLGAALAALFIGAGLYSSYTIDSGEHFASPAGAAMPEKVSFRVLDSGAYGAEVKFRKNYAVYTQESFLKLWNMIYDVDDAPPPYIDFSKEYVIAVFAGEKPTGGHSIAVASVTDLEEFRTIAVTLTSPGAECFTTQALTSPYQIIAVPLTNATTISHVDTEVSVACN